MLDEVPQLYEVCRTTHWYKLGIQLQLNTVDLDNIRSDSAVTDKLSCMYVRQFNKSLEILILLCYTVEKTISLTISCRLECYS